MKVRIPNKIKEPAAAELQIAPAEREDIPRVRGMLFAIIDEVPIYNERAKEYERQLYTLEHLQELQREDSFSILTAKANDELCGFLITKPDNGPIWLCWFAVHRNWRGLGIGAALIEQMI